MTHPRALRKDRRLNQKPIILPCSFVCILLAAGCSSFIDTNSGLSTTGARLDKTFWETRQEKLHASSKNEAKIANPPAKTIRFDGTEVLLGRTDVPQIAVDQFWNQLSSLLDERKHFTAGRYVAKNADTAEQVLWERWVTAPDEGPLRFTANCLSQNVARNASWNAMLDAAKTNPIAAKAYHSARNELTTTLSSGQDVSKAAERLRVASSQLQCALATSDTFHLLALGEFGAGRYTWAESLLLQAIELAENNHDGVRAANLWLMVAINSGHSKDHSVTPENAWKNAVMAHTGSHRIAKQQLSIHFWLRADRYRPSNTPWPESAKQALIPHAQSVGCAITNDSSSDLVIWCAIARAQLDVDEPQLALVNYKKAESHAKGDDVLWLRISQSECLAALGQTHAAAALLSGPLASKDPAISAAANATLGSSKLQSGAFQQGALLLGKAIAKSSARAWPARNKAQADLALAMLIIGESDKGLRSLHLAQRSFESEGDVASLLQSLENEVRLLEHEGRSEAADSVRQRIAQIENRQ